MKYIDSKKLIAEIERWRDKAREKYNESTYSMGRCDVLAEFRNHIASLQQEQPEVDLDSEFSKWWLQEKAKDYQVSILYERYDNVSKKTCPPLLRTWVKRKKG